MLPVKKLLALARSNAGLQADEVKVVVGELDSRIKELTQQLADSDLSHTEKDKAIKSLTDSNMELERERDEDNRALDGIAKALGTEALFACELATVAECRIAQLTEANALLREAEAEIDGMLTTVIESDCFNNGIFKPTEDLRCRLVAHLKKGDTDGG